MPGWMRPANLTPGMWREEQLIPSKSQIAFALVWFGLVPVSCCWEKCFFHLRLGVDLVQESTCRLMSVTWMGEGRRTIFLTSILFREDASETPGMVLKRLHILDVHDQDITGLRGLDLEGSGQVMNLG